MKEIIRKNGYVYLVEGEKGFEIFHYLGKDPDYWEKKEEPKEIETIEEKPKKTNRKTKKEED